jgi:hypothetical protein
MIDGMRIGNMYLSSNLTNMSLSALIYDEVNISFSGQTAESGTNGVIMNAIPRSGGNDFHGAFLANGSAPSLQGSNVTDRLRSRGTTTTDSLKKLYDINGRSEVRSSVTSSGSITPRGTSRTSTTRPACTFPSIPRPTFARPI